MKILGISGSPRKGGNTEILARRALNICKLKGEIFEKMKSADAILIGSPTYFASVSAQLKALSERSLPLRTDNYKLSGKVGGAIAVGGSRNGGQEFVLREIQNWMLLQEMVIVADRKTAHFGGIAVGRNPGDVLNDDTGLTTVENLAEKVFETASKFRN